MLSGIIDLSFQSWQSAAEELRDLLEHRIESSRIDLSNQASGTYGEMVGGSVLERAICRAKGGAPGFKVAILGTAGGIDQPLAMLMKMNPLVSVLHLYNVVNSPGVTTDISHMDTRVVVT
ncbi:hypothetical protein L6452_35985 [Arctium lappa]|uniref:Uncharacterized protein n=1 Tax=Arctium lappa TaxID=4217 RepID=A0ACB8Y7B9_ARCLA|nr:hypothetical protein L6452_35985 [Arctium lappa]